MYKMLCYCVSSMDIFIQYQYEYSKMYFLFMLTCTNDFNGNESLLRELIGDKKIIVNGHG